MNGARFRPNKKWVAGRVARWHIFKPKNPNLGKFWRVLEWHMLIYSDVIRNILRQFGKFCGHLIYYSPFWYVLPGKIWQPWSQMAKKSDDTFAFNHRCKHFKIVGNIWGHPGFESRQGVMFFRSKYIAMLLSKLNLHCHCEYVVEQKKCWKRFL
jgi:hypothetical protein